MANVACIQKAINANPYRQGSVTLRSNLLNFQYITRDNATDTTATLINSRLSNRWSSFVSYYSA